MRLREEWRRRGLGRALTIVIAVVALLLLVVTVVLMLSGHSATNSTTP
ncbi:hypothetical protein [Streptomyces spirodelae]|uniref:Uncharacterized protein n=1 Tax=Streptomyces spirodelae TaxID=2812904 RepID=A0ABS3X1H9_9ACTN|nr:hypothetical protein [Streptomyces spirodelae]MBO8188932.1 hypothetical protein [Streptomyces spirodelae]